MSGPIGGSGRTWPDEGTVEQPAKKTLGSRIRNRRQELGLSASELARRAGVTRDTLHAWESDQSEPRANKLQMLAGVLGANVGWLIGGDQRCGPAPQQSPDMAALREQLGQAREVAQNLNNMLETLEQRVDSLERHRM
jgi:transcriptional regulator with XRE-family HTH domain